MCRWVYALSFPSEIQSYVLCFFEVDRFFKYLSYLEYFFEQILWQLMEFIRFLVYAKWYYS